MEPNPLVNPICGDPHPFVKYRPYIDKQNVSHLDNSSIKDEQDNFSHG